MTHPLDLALQHTLPIAPVPRFGVFQPLASNGQRLLLGSNGLFIEVRRPWLHAISECGRMDPGIAAPFGEVQPALELTHGLLPRELLNAFVDVARSQLPNEAAGGIVVDTRSGVFALRLHHAAEASAARIDYRAQPLAEHEALVVDIHSHGLMPAGFSTQDDRDDRGSTKIAVVVGRLDRPRDQGVELAVRLCLNGLFVPLLLGVWTEEGVVACEM